MRTPEQIEGLKKRFLQALEKSLGIISQASKKSEVSRSAVYRWLEEDPEFAKKVNAVNDIVLDFAESSLHKQINDGNTTATIFLLKCKGKDRGYVERTEMEINDNRDKAEQSKIIMEALKNKSRKK